MAKTKSLLKKASRAVKKQLKNRYFKNGALSSSRIFKDVAKLKMMINAEKKRYEISVNGVAFAQLNGNAAGLYALDITPIPAVGSNFNQRSGSSIKICSSYAKFKWWNQSNNTHKTRIRMEVWKVTGPQTIATTLLAQLYQPSTLTNLIDYDSQPDPDYTGTAKKIFTKYVVTATPQYSGQVIVQDISIPLKMQHHIRYDDNTTNITDGQLILFVFADTGNCSGSTTSTTSNVPITATNTGLSLNYDWRWYYYDN